MDFLLSVKNNTFELFGLTIHWYGVILTGAMVLALLLFLVLGKREKIEVEFSLTMFLFGVIFAIIGARLFFVLPRADEYFSSWSDFLRAFNITEGGLTIMGGIPCGALGILIACIMYKKSPFRIFDLVIPCLLLGQIVGRWGNFVNEELYGFAITDPAWQKFPFAVLVDCGYECDVPGCTGWHAANCFYEMGLNIIGLVIVLTLMFTVKKKLKVGTISFFYVAWYCLVRGCLEFVKIGQKTWGGVGAVQLVCFICLPIAIICMILVQTGVIKLETEKMYDRHFKIVHEPPPYIEESLTPQSESCGTGNTERLAHSDGSLITEDDIPYVEVAPLSIDEPAMDKNLPSCDDDKKASDKPYIDVEVSE